MTGKASWAFWWRHLWRPVSAIGDRKRLRVPPTKVSASTATCFSADCQAVSPGLTQNCKSIFPRLYTLSEEGFSMVVNNWLLSYRPYVQCLCRPVLYWTACESRGIRVDTGVRNSDAFICWCTYWSAFELWCVHLLMCTLRCIWTVLLKSERITWINKVTCYFQPQTRATYRPAAFLCWPTYCR